MNLSGAWPAELCFAVTEAPSPDLRAEIGREIHSFHARTVAYEPQRFALVLRDRDDRLAAGLCALVSWQWLFIEALWVADSWRARGIGRGLMAQAEAHAIALGCHSAWLDTFQAQPFYVSLGYEPFGVLEDYPPGQHRTFFRRRLSAPEPC